MNPRNTATAKREARGRALSTIAWCAGLVVAWEIIAFGVAATKRNPEKVLPHLHEIGASILSDELVTNQQTALQIVVENAGITLGRAGLGFLLGIALGLALALAMKSIKVVEKTFFPYLMMIQMIPILGMAPIVLAITRDIDASRMVIAALLTFYPVATNTLAGLNSVEKEKLDLMRSLAATPRQSFSRLLVPSAMPYFFTGLKIAAPMAITASILVDTLQGGGGLGCMLSQSLKQAMSIYVFWQIVFFSALIGILSYYLMTLLERALSPLARVRGMAR
jgi:NitT/TauT family transport system permease protein